jgi:GTPase SAR1 family protein
MADSLQSSFQRIQISEEDLAGAKSAEVKMPILTKSLDATSRSLKLRDVSPVCVLVVGMAGSGKTTLMTSLQRSLSLPVESTDDEGEDDKGEKNSEPVGYCLNLDPATKLVPFGASIDIRDTVDYKVRRS